VNTYLFCDDEVSTEPGQVQTSLMANPGSPKAGSHKFIYHPRRLQNTTHPLRYAQLLRFITPHRNTLLLVVVLLLAVTAANLANPLFAGKLTEVLLAEAGTATLSVGALLAAWLLPCSS
jgi:hypothetical protein